MSMRAATLSSANDLKQFLIDNNLGKEDILSLQLNASGHYDIIWDAADPTGYTAGVGARNVDLVSGVRLRTIRVQASGSDATIVILGGSTITVKDGDIFEVDWEGRYKGTGAAVAGNRIAITGAGAYYFVSWLVR